MRRMVQIFEGKKFHRSETRRNHFRENQAAMKMKHCDFTSEAGLHTTGALMSKPSVNGKLVLHDIEKRDGEYSSGPGLAGVHILFLENILMELQVTGRGCDITLQ